MSAAQPTPEAAVEAAFRALDDTFDQLGELRRTLTVVRTVTVDGGDES